jgi:hypothetical protein
MNIRCFVQPAQHVTDRVQVDYCRAVHLGELRWIELGHEFLERHANQGFG